MTAMSDSSRERKPIGKKRFDYQAPTLREESEPVAEPASTGEPPDYRYREVAELAKQYAGQPPSDISVLARAVLSFLAARPSEPSAQSEWFKKCIKEGADCDCVGNCKYKPSAPQTSAEHLKKCVKEGRDCVMVCKFAAAPQPVSGDAPTIADYEEILADHRRLVRELDVLLNGEAGAAKQASLCDIVAQVTGRKAGDAPKVEEFVQTFLSRLAGLTEEQSSNVAETLSHMLRRYFPPASQTPDFHTWLTRVHGFKVGTQRNSYKESDLEAAWNAGMSHRPEVIGAKPLCLDCHGAGIINCSHFDNCSGKWVYAATPASTARTDGWVDAKVRLPKAPETNDDPEFVYVKWTEAARGRGDEDEDNPRSASGYDTCLIAYLLENPKLISHWRELLAAPGSVPQAPKRPTIVVLCGSTRFYSYFQEANYRETMAGKIVLSIGFYPRDGKHNESVGCTPEQKIALDELYFRKIELADEVLVLNVGGYMGESTTREVAYAAKLGKKINYLEPTEAGAAQPGDDKPEGK